ncbi:MAG TPA: hydroxymethylbilane synthase [Steroidobacteraceae bacterium]|nr:hydroxymethylbilane synthase [Steroidobacteraceae bacterium]
MSGAALRLGTRGSQLALWQAEHVAALIREQQGAPPVELVRIRTEGDERTDVPLWQVGGRAFFTREIDRALLAGEIDLAVHSLKDLSTTLESGLELSAVLERADSRDALLSSVAGRLEELPPGARVGTSSLRRRAFLARARPDLTLLELRGNVPTRIERLAQGHYDAIVLAAAGLVRLGLVGHIRAYLPVQQFPPAVSQGAIGVVSRSGRGEVSRWLTALNHPATRLATCAERALLKRVEGGCQVPLGALGTLEADGLHLSACLCALDGSSAINVAGESVLPPGAVAAEQSARALGERLGAELLARGAAGIIAQLRAATGGSPP